MRDYAERVKDIDEAIAKIEKYAVRGKASFVADELVQVNELPNLKTQIKLMLGKS